MMRIFVLLILGLLCVACADSDGGSDRSSATLPPCQFKNFDDPQIMELEECDKAWDEYLRTEKM